MTLGSRIRRSSIALAVIVAFASPVQAGERAAPAGCEDVQPKSRSGSCPDCNAISTTTTVSRRENTSVGPADEAYVPLTRSVPTPTATPSTPRPAVTPRAAVPAPRVEQPASSRKAEKSAAAANPAKRPAPPRAKVSIPNLPATPGMGTLLRVGITAGREIS